MFYVTPEYYSDTFKGESVDNADFPSLCERAGEIVEEMTMYRLSEESYKLMPAEVQERIKKAVCAQIEYLDANGGSEVDNGNNLQSVALGRFNYSKVSGANENSRQDIYSPRAQRLLWPTGLLYRGGPL